MKGYIITGTSSGIGKALCELLLKDENNEVIGISRTQKIYHSNYKHISLDLNIVNQIEKIKFPDWNNSEQISLIHNAGWIGPIKKLGRQKLNDITSSYMINLIAPAVLSNHFINNYKSTDTKKVILSISSGAAHTAISGWNTYCSSKSGLDMLSKCISKENPDIISLSIAPGKVDTPMQDDIRLAKKEEFPRLKEFQNYHKKGKLLNANLVAELYKKVLQKPEDYTEINHINII